MSDIDYELLDIRMLDIGYEYESIGCWKVGCWILYTSVLCGDVGYLVFRCWMLDIGYAVVEC